jgi:hypothetical protein
MALLSFYLEADQSSSEIQSQSQAWPSFGPWSASSSAALLHLTGIFLGVIVSSMKQATVKTSLADQSIRWLRGNYMTVGKKAKWNYFPFNR